MPEHFNGVTIYTLDDVLLSFCTDTLLLSTLSKYTGSESTLPIRKKDYWPWDNEEILVESVQVEDSRVTYNLYIPNVKISDLSELPSLHGHLYITFTGTTHDSVLIADRYELSANTHGETLLKIEEMKGPVIGSIKINSNGTFSMEDASLGEPETYVIQVNASRYRKQDAYSIHPKAGQR